LGAFSVEIKATATSTTTSDRFGGQSSRAQIEDRRLRRYDEVGAMPRSSSFKTVESIGRTLPDVEVTTTYGQPALKVRGKMFVCIASHKSAEPKTLVVMMDFADRDALIQEDPRTYYLKDHYLNYPCVLVRLSHVRADALHDLVMGAHRFVSARTRKKSSGRARGRVVRKDS
jgi:hypothetical protein